jgi:hypothetical protein
VGKNSAQRDDESQSIIFSIFQSQKLSGSLKFLKFFLKEAASNDQNESIQEQDDEAQV